LWLEVEAPPSFANRCLHLAQRAGAGLSFDGPISRPQACDMTLAELVRTIGTMPIYRQLFDYLCLASIAISVAEVTGQEIGAPL
jgi:hypothetical protein